MAWTDALTETPWLLAAALAVAVGLIAWLLARRARGTPDEQAGRARPKGRPYPTRDGHWVASQGEQRIANWLSVKGIPYTYEAKVAGGLRPDFRITGTHVLIEYWGLASEPSYEERMVEKITRYEQAGFDVISIFPAHHHELPDVLERELAARGLL